MDINRSSLILQGLSSYSFNYMLGGWVGSVGYITIWRTCAVTGHGHEHNQVRSGLYRSLFSLSMWGGGGGSLGDSTIRRACAGASRSS